MELFFWVCTILGILGAVAMALSGVGMDHADALSIGHDVDPGAALESLGGVHSFEALQAAETAIHNADLNHITEALSHAHEHGTELGSLAGHLKVVEGPTAHPHLHLDGPTQLSPFSSFGIFAFLAGLGVLGLVLVRLVPHWAELAIVGTALAGGITVAAPLIAVLNAVLRRVDVDSTPSEGDLSGILAEAIIPFAAHGYGELAFEIRGARMTAPGKNRSDQPIPQGAKVRMATKEGHYFMVDPLDDAEILLLARITEMETLTTEPPKPSRKSFGRSS